MSNGLFYLVHKPLNDIIEEFKQQNIQCMNVSTTLNIPAVIEGVKPLNKTTLWHHRLGHAPLNKINKISDLKGFKNTTEDICLTCPLSKFTKLPFKMNTSRASKQFELVHIDTRGPYKVETRGHYKYLLTVVDDHSRMTRVHLLR